MGPTIHDDKSGNNELWLPNSNNNGLYVTKDQYGFTKNVRTVGPGWCKPSYPVTVTGYPRTPYLNTPPVFHASQSIQPPPYADTHFNKGLMNRPGQNNCFLNSAVQVLWHLDIFRRSFRELSGHACTGESCIFCALKELFADLQYSQESCLPTDALRRALAKSFFDQQRFQLGLMDDAAECFEKILERIHYHLANAESQDMCNAQHCIPHQKFAMTLVEQSVCGVCGATSEPLPFNQIVQYVSASALTSQARQNPDHFGQLLRKAGGMGDIRDCPSACGAKIQICRTLINKPEIVSVGIVWDSERPTLEHIMEVFSTIETQLRLCNVFHSVVDHRWGATATHTLVGVVTYYGKHYQTYFYHTKLQVWLNFDDATVREIGPKWEQVVEKCRRGRYQPLLLLYAMQDGTPVSTEKAPINTIHVNPPNVLNGGYPSTLSANHAKIISPHSSSNLEVDSNKPPSGNNLRRSITPSPEKKFTQSSRRAVTPSPPGSGGNHQILRVNGFHGGEYQNLRDIQASIFPDLNSQPSPTSVDEPYINKKQVESVLAFQQNRLTPTEYQINDYLNIPRRRDSGNWSGDRNSASSTSSIETSTYIYPLGKRTSDLGYDSYSLSSNDSIMVQQNITSQLTQIPESGDCERLCLEADRLLGRSQAEEDTDPGEALNLCRMAAAKARLAMNVPYTNANGLTMAQQKHNLCVVRARTLHRRLQEEGAAAASAAVPPIKPVEIEPTNSTRTGRSRDKTPRANLGGDEGKIAIYATLPKRRGLLPVAGSNNSNSEVNTTEKKKNEKRARSEERRLGTISAIFFKNTNNTHTSATTPQPTTTTPTVGKKQHKIRKKLLMGGLIRRKNLSMPDLREGQENANGKKETENKTKDENASTNKLSQDDSEVGVKQNSGHGTLSGYLSEGHLEFSGNPSLEKSRLMRKTHPGKTPPKMTKVPPPPPLRTSSQLSQQPQSEKFDPYKLQQVYANCTNITDKINTLVDDNFSLPPYPSPAGSVCHSRQASEEFPPPPPPLESVLSLEEAYRVPSTSITPLPSNEKPPESTPHSTLLAQLQEKRHNLLEVNKEEKEKRGMENWLKELQAKQAERNRRSSDLSSIKTVEVDSTLPSSISSVKDLALKFENCQVIPKIDSLERSDSISQRLVTASPTIVTTNLKKDSKSCTNSPEEPRRKIVKKKSVSFCDEVILVATAEDDIYQDYIPNPILERVLRSAFKAEDETNSSTNSSQSSSTSTLASTQTYMPPPHPQNLPAYQIYHQTQSPHLANNSSSGGQCEKKISMPIHYAHQQQQQQHHHLSSMQTHLHPPVVAMHQHPSLHMQSHQINKIPPNQNHLMNSQNPHYQPPQGPHHQISSHNSYPMKQNFSHSQMPPTNHYIHNNNGNLIQPNHSYPLNHSYHVYNKQAPPKQIHLPSGPPYNCANNAQDTPPPSPYQQFYFPKESNNRPLPEYKNPPSGPYGPPPQPIVTSTPTIICHLCRKKPVNSPANYCHDCSFYLAKFQPKA